MTSHSVLEPKLPQPTLSRRFLWFLFAFAFILRAAYIILATDNTTIGSWLDAGPNIALNLLAGKGYISSWDICENFRSFRTPVLPLTLYALWSIFGYSVLIPKLFMGALSALTCVVMARLGARLFSAPVGIVTGLAIALCTTLVRWTGTLGMETLAVFFLTLGVWWTTEPPLFADSKWRYAPAGIALGLLCLTRPFWIPFVALIVLWLLLLGGKNRKSSLRRVQAAVLAGAVVLVMTPWVARNFKVHHAFLLASTDGGLAFLESNNPVSFRDHGDWKPGYASTLPDVQQKLPLLSEVEFDHYMFRRGLGFIAAEPKLYAEVYALRLWYLLKPSPPAHMTADLSKKHLLLMDVWWTSFDTLLLIGFARLRPWQHSQNWPALLVLLWAAVAIPLFSSQLRYRAPLEPFVLMFGAAGAFSIKKEKLKIKKGGALRASE